MPTIDTILTATVVILAFLALFLLERRRYKTLRNTYGHLLDKCGELEMAASSAKADRDRYAEMLTVLSSETYGTPYPTYGNMQEPEYRMRPGDIVTFSLKDDANIRTGEVEVDVDGEGRVSRRCPLRITFEEEGYIRRVRLADARHVRLEERPEDVSYIVEIPEKND